MFTFIITDVPLAITNNFQFLIQKSNGCGQQMEHVDRLLATRNAQQWFKEVQNSLSQQQLSELASALQLQINERRNILKNLSEKLCRAIPDACLELNSLSNDSSIVNDMLDEHLERFKEMSEEEGTIFELERLTSLRDRLSLCKKYLVHIIDDLFSKAEPDLVHIANELSNLRQLLVELQSVPKASVRSERIQKFESELEALLVRSLRVSTTQQ
jgi:hypothetical protein